ncbi:PASTA domain-containing protein [Leucobacter coleopterorum]|uniref:PASTA domain-containing protein n=1 Tax=Leucobacter coleopterorum TaxID=2714933 RepID=A0ABX6JYE4_9MICO|nr:transglycosylase domain-containing protein [Leucobacter coleopterorum]QIM17977.1 PASTA domain-containing protein [Leucobacter coleopterorum]
MTQRTSQSSRARTVKPRSAGNALGGIIGAIAMCLIAGVLVTAAVTPVVALSGMAATTAVDIFEKLPNHLNPGQLAEPSTLYASSPEGDVELATFYDQDRKTVKWEDISQYAKDATVAEEDPRFYTHGGVDVLASSRAVLQNAAGTGYSGASTVTMQYVRNVLIQEALAIPDEKESKAKYKAAMKDSIDRKLKEMKYAISIEKKYSKDEILLGYLNIALFGRKVYGIESAANFYFNKSAKDLTLAEAASLIATVNNPSKLQIDVPENIPDNKMRRDKILGSMLRTGKITQAQHDEAVATEVKPNIKRNIAGCNIAEQSETTNYGLGAFCDYVVRTIKKDPKFGGSPEERAFNFSRGGYKIYTTIDLDMQWAARQATRENVPELMDGIDVGSATTSVQVGTGRVLAMTQNRPFNNAEDFLKENPGYTTINYSTDYEDGGSSGFQVGSTFKPVTLAEWIRTGHSVRDIVNLNGRTVQENSFQASCLPDGVYGYGSFAFTNDNEGTKGNQPVLTAIANSVNGGLVSMQQKMDLCETFTTAQKLGIHRASDQATWTQGEADAGLVGQDQVGKNKIPTLHGEPRDLSMVPSNVYGGVDEIAPITMASAFAAFAGNGEVCTPMPIDRITDADDKDVAFTKSKCSEALSPEVAAGVAYALQYTVNNGLARHAQSNIGTPHLAKTGTTDDVVDNWTVGASTKVATATWVGNAGPVCANPEDPSTCGRVTTQGFVGPSGNRLMEADQTIWPATMNVADAKYGGDAFPEPSATSVQQTMVTVPDVKGKSFEEARQLLTSNGFDVIDGGEVDSSVARGLVAGTDPAAGDSIGLGSRITVNRSNGEAFPIPDGLVGATGNSAKATLSSAGFSNVDFTCEAGGKQNPSKNKVVAVNPSSGTEVRSDSQITLSLACSKR